MAEFKEKERVIYTRASYGSKPQDATVIDFQIWDGKYRIAVKGKNGRPPSIEYVLPETLKRGKL